MKRRWTKLLAALLGAALLTGCASGGSGESSGSGQGDSSQNSQKADSQNPGGEADAVTVRMTYIISGVAPGGLDRIEAAFSEKVMEKIGCKVELVPVTYADQATTYNKWFAGDESVDIICTVFQDYLAMLNAGAFQPLDGFMEEHGKAMLEKDKEKAFLEAGKYKGSLYGIPTIPSAPGNGGAMYMRKDVYDQLDTTGIDPDGYISYEEMDSLFAQIDEKCPEYTPLGIAGKRSVSNFFYIQNYDNLGVSGESCGVIVDALNNTKVENLYATEAYRTHLDWMRKWYLAGYISKDAATSEETGGDLFDAGKAATYINMSTPGTRENAENDAGTEVVQLNLCPTWMTTNVYTGVLFFVPTKAKNPEKAVEVLDLLFTDGEVSNILANGVEGEDYTVINEQDGIIEFKEGNDYVNPFGVWGDGSQWYISPPTTAEMYQKREDYLKESIDHTSKAYGYKFDATSVETEQATVKTVITKYLTQLEYGTVDVDTVLPEFLKELENAGINKIVEENQRQLDEWLAGQN